jgi:O-antigen/teichoic acid export membrane protein
MTADLTGETGRGLNRRIVRGAAWMIGMRFADRSVGFLSTIVLARLLVPADFGLVALAMAMIAAVAVFGEFGFELALIQNQKTDRSHYDTAWTLGLLRGLVATLIIAFLAEPLAVFFEDPRLAAVVLALAPVPLLEGLYNIGTVAFRKDLTLNKEFLFRIVPRLIGVVVTIAFAFAWRDYWALICGSLAGTFLRMLLSYAMHSFRPRLSVAAWREIMSFSKWMVVIGLADFTNRKLGIFMIGKFLDAGSLGVYSIASQIANMASAEVIAPIKQALFPGYAKLAHDIVLLRKAFVDAYGILVLVALPIAIGIGLTAEYYVPLLLGPKWIGAVPLIEILVISGGLRSLSSHVRPVYLAMNRPHLGAYASIGRAVVFIPMLLFGLYEYGITGAAVAHAISQVAVLCGSLYLMHRLLALRIGDMLKASWRALTACILMILAVCALKWFPPLHGNAFGVEVALLAIAVGTGIVVYVGSVLAFWWLCGKPSDSSESHVMTYISDTLRARRAPAAGPATDRSD